LKVDSSICAQSKLFSKEIRSRINTRKPWPFDDGYRWRNANLSKIHWKESRFVKFTSSWPISYAWFTQHHAIEENAICQSFSIPNLRSVLILNRL
jgi:hypothetical protein